MISRLRRAIGYIKVSEQKGVITISGVPANAITNGIRKEWETSRINKWLFIKVTGSEIQLYSFFAIELEIILLGLLNGPVKVNRRAVRCILNELRENTWLANREKEYPPHLDITYLKEIKFDLLEHQKEFIDKYNDIKPKYNLKGCLLMVPPGGGKTISDISVAVCSRAEKVFIVAPKNSIYSVWQKTLLNDMATPQNVWVAADGKPIPSDVRWCIFHYETLDKAVELARQCKNKRVTIILDESHGFNDIKSLRTGLFLELCKIADPTDIIWASGTPIKALGSEAIPLIRSIDPLFIPQVELAFRKLFGQDANKANAILSHRLGLISFKVDKSRFMKDKPIIEDRFIKIPNGDDYTLPHIKEIMVSFIAERFKYYKAREPEILSFYNKCLTIYESTCGSRELEDLAKYRNIVSIFRKKGFDTMTMMDDAQFCNALEKAKIIPALPQEYRKQFLDYRTVVKYVTLKVRGECLGRILSKERENCVMAMVDGINFADIIDDAEKKTLIFTSYVNVVDKCNDVLVEGGYEPMRVYGATNNDLPAIVQKYDKDPDANPLVATYQSLSTAVPLVMANTLIMLNSPFRYHEQDQAISRCNRIGQDAQVRVFRFFLDTNGIPNLSTRTEDIFEWSKKQVSAILGIEVPDSSEVSMEGIDFDISNDVKISTPFYRSAGW